MIQPQDLFERAWSSVDNNNYGFIYGKDIPQLIKEINSMLLNPLTSKSDDDVINTFVESKQFYKIFIDDFKPIFESLVGKSFDLAIANAKIDLSCFQSVINTRPMIFGNIRRQSNELIDNSREESFKKDIELERLRKEVDEWKNKYGFLEREFSFYQNHHGQIQDSTKHEFIINELKRKIGEQEEFIKNFQLQLNKKPLPSLVHVDVYKTSLLSLTRFLITFIGLYMLWRLIPIKFGKYNNNTFTSNAYSNIPWWEKSHLLSKLLWFLKDNFDRSTIIDNDTLDENYDALFGIQN